MKAAGQHSVACRGSRRPALGPGSECPCCVSHFAMLWRGPGSGPRGAQSQPREHGAWAHGTVGCVQCVPGAMSAAAVSFAGKVRALLGARPPTGPSVPGDAALYRTLTTLAQALAQYLLVFSKLPSHLHLPPEKERDTVKFMVMTVEVSRSAGTRAQSCGKAEAPPAEGGGSSV